jgi:hypothetical protein
LRSTGIAVEHIRAWQALARQPVRRSDNQRMSADTPTDPLPSDPLTSNRPPGVDAAASASESAARPALPDRLSTDPRSPHHHAAALQHEIVVRFNGRDRADVDEYCLSEGWIKVASTTARDRKGQPLPIKLKGKVEVFYR